MADDLARIDRVPGTRCTAVTAAGETDRLIAEASYVPIGGGVAELALTVLDRYQHAGLGRILLDALLGIAAAAGLDRLRAIVSQDNAPMLGLIYRRQWVLAEATDECAMTTLEISAADGAGTRARTDDSCVDLTGATSLSRTGHLDRADHSAER
jgi:GNAT superfamily N-acetyltransferase